MDSPRRWSISSLLRMQERSAEASQALKESRTFFRPKYVHELIQGNEELRRAVEVMEAELSTRQKRVERDESDFVMFKRQSERSLRREKIQLQENRVALCREEISKWKDEILRTEARRSKHDQKARSLGDRLNDMKTELLFKESRLFREQAELTSYTEQEQEHDDTIGGHGN